MSGPGLRRCVRAGVRLWGGPPGALVWLCPVGVARCPLGWGGGAVPVPPVWSAPPSWCVSWCPSLRPLPQCHGPWPFLFPVSVVLRSFFAPVLCCPRCPVPVGACLLPGTSPRPLAAGLPFALFFLRCACGGVVARTVGRRWPMFGVGWSGATGRGFRGCRGGGGQEEGFSCCLPHGGLKGGLVWVGRGAGEDFPEGVDHVHPLTHSRSPGPLRLATELPQGGGRPPGEVGGGPGRGGLRAQGPGAAVAGAGGGGCVSVARGT